jgi:hypothetical protein
VKGVREIKPMGHQRQRGGHTAFIFGMHLRQTQHSDENFADCTFVELIGTPQDPCGLQKYGLRDPDRSDPKHRALWQPALDRLQSATGQQH